MMTRVLPLSILIMFSLLLPVLVVNPATGGPIEEGFEGEVLTIDLGSPVFDIARSFIDGREWSTIEMEDALYPPTNGEPSVPVYSHPLRLRNSVIDIELVRSDPVTIPLPRWIPPSPSIAPLTEEFLNSGESTGIDPDLGSYSSGSVYPQQPLLWSSTGYGWKEGERYAHYSVSASPFDYRPDDDKLTYYRNVQLKVTLGEPQPTMEDMSSEPTRNGVRAVDKPAAVKEGTELLVIAYDQFQNELRTYVDWNMEKGTLTSMVPISTVDSSYPSMDQASSIWQYIHDTYFGDEQNLKYVLLAGEVRYVRSRMAKDLDPYAPAGEPPTLPADTYFACLDGDYQNWNEDGDSNWAELNDISDYIPEVYVSRISLDTESEATKWANLVVNYEKNVEIGSWAGTAGMFGSTTHVAEDGPTQCEYLWDEYLNGVYPTRERYYSEGYVKDGTGAKPLTYSSIHNGIKDGLSIIVYMGHGHRQVWSEGTNDNSQLIYSVNEAGSLSQSPRLPFISAMSCETNWFDGTNFESISEGFTENPNGGAIAYVGAVRTTEGGIGYNDYYPGAPGIQEDLLRMMKQGYRNTGEIFHKAKEYYVDSFSNYFIPSWEFAYNAYIEHNMLGAPETPLWTRSPDTFTVTYDYTKDHYSNFTVQVRDSGNDPVPGAKVTVYSSTLEIMSTSETLSNGIVRIPFHIPETAYATVTVSKEDFKPYQDDLVIMDLSTPETSLVSDFQNPNGLNGWYTVDPNLRFSSSEPAETYYKWNMGAVTKYTGGPLDLPEGDFLLEYWSVDMSENEEERKTMEIKFDPTEPVFEVMVLPEEPDGADDCYITTPRILTDIDPDGGSPHWVEYWYERGQRETSNGTIHIPDGISELHIQAVDEAGNRAEELVYDFEVDTVVPTTTLNTGGNEPNELGWFTIPMSVELHCDDRYSDTYYSWDDQLDWERYTSDINPPTGNHTLYFYSEDPNGNIEPIRSAIIAYDTMAPELEVRTEPNRPDGDDGWFTTSPKMLLNVFNEDSGHRILYRMNDEEERVYTSPVTIVEGEWTITCYAVDDAGNRGNTQTVEIKVDTRTEVTKSTVDLSTNINDWYTDLPGITLQTGEGAQIHYNWDGSSQYSIYNGMLIPPAEEGEFILYYYSMDAAGNRESSRQMIVNVDAKAPDLEVTAPDSGSKGKIISFDLSGTTDGIGVDSYFIDYGDGATSGWVEEPKIEHSYSSAGTYSVSIKARDAVGHESDVYTMDILIEDDSSSMMLVIMIAVAAGLIITVLIIGAALVVRSRHHHHHHHHQPPVHNQLPRPPQHVHQQGRPLPQRPVNQLPPKQPTAPRPPIDQPPPPPAKPAFPQPPKPPI